VKKHRKIRLALEACVAIDDEQRNTTAPANPLPSPKQKKRIEKQRVIPQQTEQADQKYIRSMHMKI
jgi:hypothetical protein